MPALSSQMMCKRLSNYSKKDIIIDNNLKAWVEILKLSSFSCMI